MERLPDHSEFDEKSRPHVDLTRQTITEIAQSLYDIYANSGMNISDWITCLSDYLSEHFMNMSPEDVLLYIKEKIIRGDNGINLDEWPYNDQQEKIREVAEWLSAEKICEGMVVYEQDIEFGIKEGRYQEIYSIEEVTVVKDHIVFHGRRKYKHTKGEIDEIKRNITEDYVIKKSEMLGHGTRVNVFELVPRHIPMPIPRRDELIEGLNLQSPNKFLVARILRESYRQTLGNKVDASEEEAIGIFVQAKKHLVFPDSGRDIDMIQDETAGQADEVLGEKTPEQKIAINSFIPPLIIIKAKLSENSEPEYITIQKKVNARGQISRNDNQFKSDVRNFPNFRNKVKLFLEACKRFYKKTEDSNIPDTVGRGNVLYTRKGNIYLVDINNMMPEPDYRLLSLIMLLNEINNSLKSPYYKEHTNELKSEYFKVIKEIFEVIGSEERYKDLDIALIQKIVENIYMKPNDKDIHRFLRDTNMLDDKDEPIFMHNIDNLLRIEREVLNAELEGGLITEEQLEEKMAAIREECMYKIFTSTRGVWKNQRDFNIMEIIKNKNEGHDNWMAYYIPNLYSCIRQKHCAG